MLSRSVVVSDGIAQLHEPHNGKKLESHAECKKYDRASRDFLPVIPRSSLFIFLVIASIHHHHEVLPPSNGIFHLPDLHCAPSKLSRVPARGPSSRPMQILHALSGRVPRQWRADASSSLALRLEYPSEYDQNRSLPSTSRA